jgi:predicted transposase/invertase (TIGR01784 family)
LNENELNNRLDKWLYFIKNIEDFQSIPTIFKDAVFEQAFAKAELSKMEQIDIDRYEYSLKTFRDNQAVYEYAMETAVSQAFDAGGLDGELRERMKVAKKLRDKGLDIDFIIETTGLTAEEINKL